MFLYEKYFQDFKIIHFKVKTLQNFTKVFHGILLWLISYGFKNNKKTFVYRNIKKLNENFERKFLLPCFDDETKEKHFYNNPVMILYGNHKVISEMISVLSYKQRKHFLRLDGMMKRCDSYISFFRTYKKHSFNEYRYHLQKGIGTIIAFNSFLLNDEIFYSLQFVAFQLNFTDSSKWTTWNDIYEYCKEKSFGFVIDTSEGYSTFKNNMKPDKKDIPSIIEESFISFDLFIAFLENLLVMESF